MKKYLPVLLLIPILSFSQSKKKLRQAEQKANAELSAHLLDHIKYLADDKLEGRRTGTKGEELAMQYITDRYREMGLEPRGTTGYVQEFEINEGRQIDETTVLTVDGKKLLVQKDYFPLAFSATKTIKGSPAIALSESGQPWFKDLKEVLEENKNNPHFDVEEEIRRTLKNVTAKGATALFVYNSSALVDNIQFNKNDKTETAKIPVIYLTKDACRRYFADNSATLEIEATVHFSEKSRKARNIIGYINNRAPNTVIIGAHYDHLGYNEDKYGLDTNHLVHNGADDNASGTAAVIELARMLKKKAPVNNNYLILNFSAEEMGLLGSKYWIEHPTVNITPDYMINLDMVGRYDTAHKLTVGGYGTSSTWSSIIAATPNPGNLLVKFDSTGSGPSDHASFYRRDIPVLFLFTGSHSDYHKSTDDWEKVNIENERDIVNWVYNLIEAADNKGKLAFSKTTETKVGGVTGLKVTLGVMPDYGFTGTGMRIDGVSPGKLAEKTGLQAGDVLLQLGDYKFVDVMSYMQALGKFNKGDKTKLRVRRGTEEKLYEIEF